MAYQVNPIRNGENFTKYVRFYLETATSVFIKVFYWLYNGPKPPELNLFDFINNKVKKKELFKKEIEKLENLKLCKAEMKDFDITFIYKIIQLTCDVVPKEDKVWTEECPSGKKSDVEHLLYTIKEGRNELANPSEKFKCLTNEDIKKKSEEMKMDLKLLLKAASAKVGTDSSETNEIIEFVRNDIDRICKANDPDYKIDIRMLQKFLRNDLSHYLDENSDKYSLPNLRCIHEDVLFPLQSVFNARINDNHPNVIVVAGEAGMGKTSLSKYMSHLWITEATNKIDKFSTFDFVLMVECKNINTRSVSEFLESVLTTTSNFFPNTTSLRKHIHTYRVLWVLDGFDECTSEAKGFLSNLLTDFSESHKLLITSRLYFIDDIKKFFDKRFKILYAGILFCDTNIHEILSNVIGDELKIKEFIEFFNGIPNIAGSITNPLKIKLASKIWMRDPQLLVGNCSLTYLLEKISELELELLEKRFEGKNPLSSKDLKNKISKWFDILGKVSFEMILKGKFAIIDGKPLKMLEEEAEKCYLVFSDCISTFSIQLLVNRQDKLEQCQLMHVVQQTYFAALYLKKSLNFDLIDKIVKCSKRNVEVKYHCCDMLGQLIEISESSFIDSNIQLIFHYFRKLLGMPVDFPSSWYQVFRASNFHDVLIKRAAQTVNIREWNVKDDSILFFELVLKYAQPKVIFMEIRLPKTLDEQLKNFLKQLTNIEVQLTLIMDYHMLNLSCKENSDEFMDIISAPDSKLQLIHFRGCLSDCESFLKNSNNMKYLNRIDLKIPNYNCFKCFCNGIGNAKNLTKSSILLSFDIETIDEFPICHKLPQFCILYLLGLNDINMLRYIELTKSVCQKNGILVNKDQLSKASFQLLWESLFDEYALNFYIRFTFMYENSVAITTPTVANSLKQLQHLVEIWDDETQWNELVVTLTHLVIKPAAINFIT